MKTKFFTMYFGLSVMALAIICGPLAAAEVFGDNTKSSIAQIPEFEHGRIQALARLSPAEMEAYITPHVAAASRHYGIDPVLVLCLIRQESGFRPTVQSKAGAAGLMQFIPSTARRFGLKVSLQENVDERFDPVKSVWAGVAYLRFLHDLFGQCPSPSVLALAGYNAGEHRVIDSGYTVPNITETKNYVSSILSMYTRMKSNSPIHPISYGPQSGQVTPLGVKKSRRKSVNVPPTPVLTGSHPSPSKQDILSRQEQELQQSSVVTIR